MPSGRSVSATPSGIGPRSTGSSAKAHAAYLRGRWGESRGRLERLLELDDSDGDALMQFGVLYVRTNQPAWARRTFRRCLESKQGAKWRWEIHHELNRLSDGS